MVFQEEVAWAAIAPVPVAAEVAALVEVGQQAGAAQEAEEILGAVGWAEAGLGGGLGGG